MRILKPSLLVVLLALTTARADAGTVRPVNSASWDKEVLSSSKAVLVDFWAPWCGWCKKLSPVVEKVATSMPDVKFVKVNVDENEDLAKKYEIEGLPTLFLFRGGEALGYFEGYVEQDELKGMIERALGKSRSGGLQKEKVGPFSGYPKKATK